jgi:rhodanese-related sulfurtransferase
MTSTVSTETLRTNSSGYGTLIDVRSAADFATGHIPGALNVPMEQVENRLADIGEGHLVLICEAGTRASIVATWLKARQPVVVLEGGTKSWRNAGLPLVTCAPCRWTLERQVRLTAGLIVLIGTVLATLVNPKWIYLAMFVGAGLTFAGATNLCGMAVVLARMPWNRDGKSKLAPATDSDTHCRM